MTTYPPLITVERAVQNSQLSYLNGTNAVYLSSLIDAATKAVRRFCVDRIFNLSTFAEYYTVGIKKKEVPLICLRQFPIQSIQRVGIMSRALQVQNSNTNVYSRASVSTTNLGLVLQTTANGVDASPINLYYGTYPTISLLSAAITAQGNGWTSSIQSGQTGSFGIWASTDLKPTQGAVSVFLGGAYLELPQDSAILSYGPWGFDGDDAFQGYWNTSGPGWRLDTETGEMWINSPRGPLNLRVDYTAGFEQVPEDVQEATVMTAISIWQMGKINPTLKSEGALDYNYTLADKFYAIPEAAQTILNTYRDWSRYAYR